MRQSIIPVFLVVLIFFGTSCKDEEAIVPAYLYIDHFDLEVSPDNRQGNGENDFVDAWVYINGQLIGAFELPAMVPVVQLGQVDITVLPGIKKNGQASVRVVYPFVTGINITRELKPDVIDTIPNTIEYKPTVQFPWIEDFEDRLISLEKSGFNTSIDSFVLTDEPELVRNYDPPGSRYTGMVDMDTGFQIFEVSTITNFNFPRATSDIYLEFDFKADLPVQVGLYPLESSDILGIPVVTLFETNGEWKRAYIGLTEDVNNPEYEGLEFKVFFYAATAGEVPNQKVYLDNLKIIHF
jgi:hypothetical protein